MRIVGMQFTDKHLLIMVQTESEGLTVTLHRDIRLKALGKHLSELAAWLG